MTINWVDVAERAGWTAVQALAGSVIAAGASTTVFDGFDWRSAAVGVGSAAVLSVLKTVGVGLSGSATAGQSAGAAQVLTSDVVSVLAEAIDAAMTHTHPVPRSAVESTQAMPTVIPSPAQPAPQPVSQPAPAPAPAPAQPVPGPVSAEAAVAALSATSART